MIKTEEEHRLALKESDEGAANLKSELLKLIEEKLDTNTFGFNKLNATVDNLETNFINNKSKPNSEAIKDARDKLSSLIEYQDGLKEVIYKIVNNSEDEIDSIWKKDAPKEATANLKLFTYRLEFYSKKIGIRLDILDSIIPNLETAINEKQETYDASPEGILENAEAKLAEALKALDKKSPEVAEAIEAALKVMELQTKVTSAPELKEEVAEDFDLDAEIRKKFGVAGFTSKIEGLIEKKSLDKEDVDNTAVSLFVSLLKQMGDGKYKDFIELFEKEIGTVGQKNTKARLASLNKNSKEILQQEIFSSKNVGKFIELATSFIEQIPEKPAEKPESVSEESAPTTPAAEFIKIPNFSLDALKKLLKESKEGFQTKLSENDFKKIVALIAKDLADKKIDEITIKKIEDVSVEMVGKKCTLNIRAKAEGEINLKILNNKKEIPIKIEVVIRSKSKIGDGLVTQKNVLSSSNFFVQMLIKKKEEEIVAGLDSALGDINEKLLKAMQKEIPELKSLDLYFHDGELMVGLNQDISLAEPAPAPTRTKEKNAAAVESATAGESITETITTYVRGDDLYDEVFNIEVDGEFRGEYGVGTSNVGADKSKTPKKVAAMELWLFDKSTIINNTSIFLVAPNMDNQAKMELSDRQVVKLHEDDQEIIIPADNFIMKATVKKLEIDGEGKFIKKLTLQMKIFNQDGEEIRFPAEKAEVRTPTRPEASEEPVIEGEVVPAESDEVVGKDSSYVPNDDELDELFA